MASTSISATGRRKSAVARVTIVPGKGGFTVNGRPMEDYLARPTLASVAKSPLELTETVGSLDITCRASGGGSAGQAGAIRLALSRALMEFNGEFKLSLRKAGFLTRDAREVERKKFGQPKARKRFQYSKR